MAPSRKKMHSGGKIGFQKSGWLFFLKLYWNRIIFFYYTCVAKPGVKLKTDSNPEMAVVLEIYHVLNELGRQTVVRRFPPFSKQKCKYPRCLLHPPQGQQLINQFRTFPRCSNFLQAVCFLSCRWWLNSRDTHLGREGTDIPRSFQSHPCLQAPADFPWMFPVQHNRL